MKCPRCQVNEITGPKAYYCPDCGKLMKKIGLGVSKSIGPYVVTADVAGSYGRKSC